MSISAQNSAPAVPLGIIKSFGPVGSKYEVIGPSRPLQDGDWLVKIKLVETGEETEYRYTRLMSDPEAS